MPLIKKDPRKDRILDEACVLQPDTLCIELVYPRINNNLSHIEVGLLDVRATDSVRLHFDFERNGWSVEQASTFSWDADDNVRDRDWQEVAFVPAYNRTWTCPSCCNTNSVNDKVCVICGKERN